jgi:hypothetical protein
MHVGPSDKEDIKHLLSFVLVSCLAYSLTLKMEVTRSSEVPAEYQWLHSIIFQKTELLISDPNESLICLVTIHNTSVHQISWKSW